MKIKKGDNVIIIAGKDKGKKGKILETFPRLNRVVVDGANIAKVSTKPRTKGGKGEVVERAMPLNASNVMIVDAKTGKRTRIGIKEIAGKNVRIAKKSGNEI
ncbi:MAG: 50S ribosomal protein L24 [Candidatus Yonathbacteria bacterium RBG_16_43_6]|jgi:large subunit ribosomal protein L24|uniref:Large ribosomal subunit protein uL24 n=1 Tax=Candidatus Yonathbacteria bacterium RIFCSPLOWO2_01_FULL_43_27 TaxID=1802726 RepID=A0A1G2SDW8_9BACT|nr:MAG: 50S ribosomal protein L24 [Candidatus Yonathbacteria bacterium RIFCSPHIGHO2_01_FULL_44_19]OHA80330.1 MAG: 50S ribosomal protein L24 [Candidatus Yonathbacteria bacterium RBG_16_43_6]OHA83253.1 MAG: 50S ribosomal protein L24 [Candidatus Yonathbacteria bacterium RIFCSPLOWO2_01_FULL_43_27]